VRIELLFDATLLLIAEFRIALKAVKYDMNFVLHQSQKLALVNLLKRSKTRIARLPYTNLYEKME
jgi:hypothetical protein